MSGITDIKNAFAKAAPGIDLRAVRMRYDAQTSDQVFEFDICRSDGSKQTIVERFPAGVMTPGMIELAKKVAEAVGAKVDKPELVIPSENTSQLAEKAAEGIAKLVSGTTENPYIEHDGETYELAVDDKPKALFF